MKHFRTEDQERCEWLRALRKETMRGLNFQTELDLAEVATSEERWEQADLHLTSSLRRLEIEGFDYFRWAACLSAHVRLHLQQNRLDLAIQVLRFGATEMFMSEGPEHPLTRHFERQLSRLNWSKACGDEENLVCLIDELDGLTPDRARSCRELIAVIVHRFCSWGRCLDFSYRCLAHGQLQWAEVACWSALTICGSPADPRFLETMDRLSTLYSQAEAPTLAAAAIRWAAEESQKTLGETHPSTIHLLNRLKACLPQHDWTC